MKKRTSVSVKPRFNLTSTILDDKVSDLAAGCEHVFKSILGGFMHRRDLIRANDHLMRGLDTWEDRNGFKRQR